MKSETGLSTNFSQRAEESIILPLFEHDFFSDTTIQRKLALYPSVPFTQKTVLVKELLHTFWRSLLGGDFINVLSEFEQVLALIGKRGHFVHQFEVFLLGLRILAFFHYCEHNEEISEAEFDDVAQTWLLVATSHDFGYPMESVSTMLNQIASMYEVFGFDKVEAAIQETSKKIQTIKNEDLINEDCSQSDIKDIKDFLCKQIVASSNLTDIDSTEFIKKLEADGDHGFVSAIMLIKMLCILPNLDGQMNRLQKATAAIALHTSTPCQNSDLFCYEKNKYAYVLFLADNLQDWSRNISNDIKLPSCKLKKFETMNDQKELSFNFVLSSKQWDEITKDEHSVKEGTISWLKNKTDLIYNASPQPGTINSKIKITYTTSEEVLLHENSFDL